MLVIDTDFVFSAVGFLIFLYVLMISIAVSVKQYYFNKCYRSGKLSKITMLCWREYEVYANKRSKEETPK